MKCLSQLEWYGWKAREFEKAIGVLDPGRIRVLEIGSGPVGIVNYLPWDELYAIDPLEEFYRKNPALIALRNPKVSYSTGIGEDLPFERQSFSVVIIDNVLDHTCDPMRVLEEVARVLYDNGLLYVTLNVRTKWGSRFHAILALLEIDQGHPYSFTRLRIRECLRNKGFSIALEIVEDHRMVRRKNRLSKKSRDRLKSYVGLSECLYTAVCRKSPLVRSHEVEVDQDPKLGR